MIALAATVAAACTSSGDDGESQGEGDEPGLTVEAVSSRPEYVSGGDALLAVTVPDDSGDPAEVEVTAGDQDVTESFTPDPDDAQRLVGLVDDLPDGDTTVTARLGDESAEVTLTNHPINGPLFSGEHLELAACTTEVFGLEPSTPEDQCAAPTQVAWRYVDSSGETHELPDPSQVPDDAEMVDVDGESVPFILRDETGVINRSVYRITIFEPQPDPAEPTNVDTSAWNERLLYQFGGGCGSSFTQGASWVGDPSLEVLRRGYAAATATFNTFQVMCNDVLSAETMAMVKEHFTETYGEPVHTIGEGGSGGAIQQLLIAQNYPGLLDAIAPGLVFPDALSISPGVFDCGLLTNYYETSEGSQLSEEQRAAINGHAVARTCDLWDITFAPNIDPVAGCQSNIAAAFGGQGEAPLPSVPEDEIYDPETNPDGWRCSNWDSNVHITGRDPETGHARSGYDNQGVQYGLDALNAGVITPGEFLDLNESIGGFDADGQPQPERSMVPEDLVTRAYETGRVTGPWGGIPDTPMLVLAPFTDPVGDIHDRVRVFQLLERLADEEGNVPETVSVWSFGVGEDDDLISMLSGALGESSTEPTFVLDEWLTAAEEHQETEGGSWQDALAETKPEAAQSQCLVGDDEPIVGPEATEDEACNEAYPPSEEPRMAAGGPLAGDQLKCQLIPVSEAGDQYEVDLNDSQMERLEEIFPDGVCDWSQPSVGYSEPTDTWINYLDQ